MDIRRKEHSYLAKAKCIILVLLDLAVPKRSDAQYAEMTNVERDAVFKQAIADFFKYFFYRDTFIESIAELEKKRIGEKSYLTMYDHLTNYVTEHEVANDLDMLVN